MAVLTEDLDDRLCGGFNHVKALVLRRRAQETHELRVGFYGNEACVRAHAPQHFRRDAANTGAIFHYHARLRPVDRLQQLLDQEPRAGNDRAEHPGMTKKIAREQQSVSGSRPARDSLLVRHNMSGRAATHLRHLYSLCASPRTPGSQIPARLACSNRYSLLSRKRASKSRSSNNA